MRSNLVILISVVAVFAFAHSALAVVVPSLDFSAPDLPAYSGAYHIDTDENFMYVVGTDSSVGNAQWRIEKRNISDGSLVYATTTNPSSGTDAPLFIKLNDPFMYIGGYDFAPGNAQWRIEKRNISDGSLVYATTTNPGTSWDILYAIDVDDTYMYLAGYDRGSGDYKWRIEKRALSDASLSYATTSNPGGTDILYDMDIDDTYMYLVGYADSGTARYEQRNLSDGALVFSTSTNPSANGDSFESVVVDGDYVYMVGYDSVPGVNDTRILVEKRAVSDGSLIYSTATNPENGAEFASYDLQQYGDFLYGVAYSNPPDYSSYSQHLAKISMADGSVVYSSSSRQSEYDSELYGLAIRGSTMYVVGYEFSDDGSTSNWNIDFYDLNPAPVIGSYSASVATSSIVENGDAFTLTINGTDFTSSTVARLKGTALSTTYVTSTQLTASVTADVLSAAGDFPLVVKRTSPSYEIAESSAFTFPVARMANVTVTGSSGGSSGSRRDRDGETESKTDESESSDSEELTKVTTSSQFTRNLKLGDQGSDVLELQRYLNANGFILAESGPGSVGNETSYFGALTKAALILFQNAHADEILVPVGLSQGTGYFGPSTRAFIARW